MTRMSASERECARMCVLELWRVRVRVRVPLAGYDGTVVPHLCHPTQLHRRAGTL